MMAQNVQKLKRTNFLTWSENMRIIFKHAGIADVLDDNFDASQPQSEMKDKFLYELLTFAVDDEHRVHVNESQGGRKSWDALRNFLSPEGLTHQVHLIVRILSSKMDYGSNIRTHINRMLHLFAELAMAGHVLDDNVKVLMIINSLSDEYDQVIESFDNRADITVQSFVARLINEYDIRFCEPLVRQFENSGLRVGPSVNKRPRRDYPDYGGRGSGSNY